MKSCFRWWTFFWEGQLFKEAENFSQLGLPGILHSSCSTGLGEDHCGGGGVSGGGESGCVANVDKISWIAWLASHTHTSLVVVDNAYVDQIGWFAWHLILATSYMYCSPNHENPRFSYSLLKHHGYIDWRTVGMRECYWCTLDIIETVGLSLTLKLKLNCVLYL